MFGFPQDPLVPRHRGHCPFNPASPRMWDQGPPGLASPPNRCLSVCPAFASHEPPPPPPTFRSSSPPRHLSVVPPMAPQSPQWVTLHVAQELPCTVTSAPGRISLSSIPRLPVTAGPPRLPAAPCPRRLELQPPILGQSRPRSRLFLRPDFISRNPSAHPEQCPPPPSTARAVHARCPHSQPPFPSPRSGAAAPVPLSTGPRRARLPGPCLLLARCLQTLGSPYHSPRPEE